MQLHKPCLVGYLYITRLQISYSVYVPKIIENWLAVDKVIAKISGLTFWPTLLSITVDRQRICRHVLCTIFISSSLHLFLCLSVYRVCWFILFFIVIYYCLLCDLHLCSQQCRLSNAFHIKCRPMPVAVAAILWGVLGMGSWSPLSGSVGSKCARPSPHFLLPCCHTCGL